jgi:predicted histone-like DNA-binding protein
MSIKYRLIQKINPKKPTDPKKVYASVATQGEVSLRELGKEIAEVSTVSLADVTAVVESMLQVIERHVTRTMTVRLGELGSMSLRVSSEGAATEEEFTPSMIKDTRLRFRPGKEIRQAIKNTPFEKTS